MTQRTRNTENKSREMAAHANKARPDRVPMGGAQLKLALPAGIDLTEDFVPRWFLDKPGRLEAAEAAYWEYVTYQDSTDKVSRPSGANTMFLMKIRQEYWDESQQLKTYNIKRLSKANNQLKKTGSTHQYFPSGHGEITTVDNH